MPDAKGAKVRFEHAEPILYVRDMAASVKYYVDVLGFTNLAMIRTPPANRPWAYEMRVSDPDGHVLRFGSEPREDEPFV